MEKEYLTLQQKLEKNEIPISHNKDARNMSCTIAKTKEYLQQGMCKTGLEGACKCTIRKLKQLQQGVDKPLLACNNKYLALIFATTPKQAEYIIGQDIKNQALRNLVAKNARAYIEGNKLDTHIRLETIQKHPDESGKIIILTRRNTSTKKVQDLLNYLPNED